MKVPTPSPELLPLFRSETQAQLLAEIYFGTPTSGSELARRLNLPQPTVSREISRLAQAGVVTFDQIGRSKIVQPADTPYAPALRQLVAYAAGLPHVIRDVYDTVRNIDEIFIHGSWAARFQGEPGPPPHDVDLVVVSATHTRFTLAEHRAKIESLTGLTVDQLVLPPDHERLTELRSGAVPVIKQGDHL